MHEVAVAPLDPARIAGIIGAEQRPAFKRLVAGGREALAGRVVWNVNSTSAGGGVAELLWPLIGYCRGAGVDARWLVLDGDESFFAITKRIHNRLHGSDGDGGELGAGELELVRWVAETNAAAMRELVAPGDIVLLHDPQTAALAAPLRELGARVVWRCHVGVDDPGPVTRSAWEFLLPLVAAAEAYVFSRDAFVWDGIARDDVAIIAPSIDAFAVKNQELDPGACAAILAAAGITAGDGHHEAVFTRRDGTPGRVDRRAQISGGARVPDGVPLVTQVSRWDSLKDPLGVIEGFVAQVAPGTGAHLLLVGPEVAAVTDDPEGLAVLEQCRIARERLDAGLRSRIHLITVPMADPDENAAIVNAIQRSSAVIVQKSLAEGFGLTVTEGMWKGRPVVAGAVGGIQDQIVDGECGLLVDPRDLGAFGTAVAGLIADPARAERLGVAARDRVRERFLASRHLAQYLELFTRLGATAQPG